jgi:EAL domain-containing protein (putative c-di-GMP-specific phosphodiesterase class I)/CHASE2 domain-containing sensor protein
LLARWGFALACVLLGLAYGTHFIAAMDNRLAAWRSQVVERAPTQSIVAVEIDSNSVRAAGQWPWPRTRYAQAIRNLREAGANLIAFDVDFSARSTTADDAALSHAIGDNPASIVLPTFLQANGLTENAPLTSLSRDALIASVNIPIDSDGVARRYAQGYGHNGHYHASIAGMLAGAAYGDNNQFLIDYSIRVDDIPRLSFNDVYRGTFDPELVRGRHVLIGATALELGDEFATPTRPGMPGVYVHALAYESLVQGRALTRVSDSVIFLLALCVLAFLWPRRRVRDIKYILFANAAVAATLLFAPIAVQTLLPLRLDIGLVLIAQTLGVIAHVQRELQNRTEALARQREEHLRYIAYHDPETDLPNRRAMIEAAACSMRGRGEGAAVAMAIGIERFPILRSAIGHINANQLVRKLAERISGQNKVVVHHLSSSVLGVVFVTESAESARRMCELRMSVFDRSFEIAGADVEVALRLGFAASTDDTDHAEQLLENAMHALDMARRDNRRHVTFDAVSAPDPRVQLALTSDIHRGLARAEFRLLYQPKVCARTGVIVGAEALMRWSHPTLGDISPERFINAAEETGAIHDLTKWALNQTIADHRVLSAHGAALRLSVNLSGRSLSDAEFCADAVQSVTAADVDICVEITETAIIEDPLAAISSIEAFREAGVKISIDDYGSGLSSLGYLKQINADELKLDKSLITDIGASARDRLILKSTIDLAHGLGMSVVAEGIEDEMTLAIVRGLGCDVVQGYVIARPLSLGDLAHFCASAAQPAAAKIA